MGVKCYQVQSQSEGILWQCSFKNELAEVVFGKIDSWAIKPSKSEILRGVLLRVTMHLIPALFAAFTPRGAFSTTMASDSVKPIFVRAVRKGSGLGLPSSRSSPVTITSKASFPKYLLIIESTSCLAAPDTNAFLQRILEINSLAPLIGAEALICSKMFFLLAWGLCARESSLSELPSSSDISSSILPVYLFGVS